MCPDRQIISLYLDGELPSPWKEKMETHLESCPECRTVLAGYRNLGASLEDAPKETIEAARDRVWKKLTAPELVISGKTSHQKPVKGVWNRSVTLPLPAAAAAALAIVAVFFALTVMMSRPRSLPQDAVAAAGFGLDDQGTVPMQAMQDMSGVLKYLSGQDEGDIMIIRLPENRNFSRAGEPALINAADYSRTRNPQ